MDANQLERTTSVYFEKPLASSTFVREEKKFQVILRSYTDSSNETKYIDPNSIEKGLVGNRITFWEEKRKQLEDTGDSGNNTDGITELGKKCENCLMSRKCSSGSYCSQESLSSGVSSGFSAVSSDQDEDVSEKKTQEKPIENAREKADQLDDIDEIAHTDEGANTHEDANIDEVDNINEVDRNNNTGNHDNGLNIVELDPSVEEIIENIMYMVHEQLPTAEVIAMNNGLIQALTPCQRMILFSRLSVIFVKDLCIISALMMLLIMATKYWYNCFF